MTSQGIEQNGPASMPDQEPPYVPKHVKFPTKELVLPEAGQSAYNARNVKFPTRELALPKDLLASQVPGAFPRLLLKRDTEAIAWLETQALSPIPASLADSVNAAVEYLEAHDLYTPMFPQKEEEKKEETFEEEPLVSTQYTRPFNIFEELVETEVNIMLSRYIDICRCHQCRADIVALSLQQLPSYYVTGSRGTETARRIIASKYMQRIMNAVTKSIQVVFKKPRSSCRKVRQVLWIRPHLEEAPMPPSADLTGEGAEMPLSLGAEPELQLSEEIEELIKLVQESQAEETEEGQSLNLIEALEEESHEPHG